MHPRDIRIKDYTYDLPEEKIAHHPLPGRDNSKLLVYRNGLVEESRYSDITQHLPPNAFLVFNNTKVVEARLLFQKDSGGIVEVFVLEPHSVMLESSPVRCNCLIGGASKWKHGMILQKQAQVAGKDVVLRAAMAHRHADSFEIEFSWEPALMRFEEVISVLGVMPIPPYLKRETEATDNERYQTIYARHNGSVAAPTAGLHFTEKVFESFKSKNIQQGYVTLHVGAGTFMPVKSELMQGHAMHPEYLLVEPDLIRKLISNAGNIFAVGTTAMRTLESLYWMGVKCIIHPGISRDQLELSQWEVYDELFAHAVESASALAALLQWMTKQGLRHLYIKTRILIAPGYQPMVIKGLITNFHQPDSTLLLLVAAVIGDDWRKVYHYAIENDFRFLSYGDGCLLFVA